MSLIKVWNPMAKGANHLLFRLVAISLVTKIAMVIFSKEINVDAVRYLNAARLFFQGDFTAGISTGSRTFLYPWLIQSLHPLVPDWVLSGQLISAVAMSLALAPFFLIARNLFGDRAALWFGLAFVLSPILNGYSIEIIREPLFLFFFGSALWAMLRVIESRRPLFALLAFIFAAASFLCRIEAILAPVFFLIFLVACTFLDRNFLDKRFKYVLYIFMSLSIVSGAIVVTSASASSLRFDDISLYIREILSGEVLANYHLVYNQTKAFAATLPNAQWSYDFGSTAAKMMPIIYLMGLFSGFCSVLYPPFFALLAYGLFKVRLPELKHKFFFFLALFYLVSAYVFIIRQNFISERYLLAPAMLLLPWLGVGMERLSDILRGRRVIFAAALAFFFILPAWTTMSKIQKHESTLSEVGTWIKGNLPLNRQIFFNDERLALYAGGWRGEYTMFADHEWPGIGGDWVIYQVSAKKEAPSAELEHLELVKVFKGTKKSVFIYKRKGTSVTAQNVQ